MSLSVTDQLAVAKRNRERYFQRVQLCYDYISKPTEYKQFLARCAMMEDTFAKFEQVTDQIAVLNESLPEGESPLEILKVTKSFEEMFFGIKAHEANLMEKIEEKKKANLPQPAPIAQGENVRLPTISVPIFDGQITQFPSWRSLYEELIHNSSAISSIQKFSYLKSYVAGSALATIEGIAFASENYNLAYNTLVERFSKKRLLASHHINTILQFQPLTSDSVDGLRSFLDNYYVPVQSLKGLNIRQLDDFILVQLALRVLDPKTSREFETEQVLKDVPTFSDLVEFIKNKCNILDVLVETSGEAVNKPAKNRPPAKSLVTSVEPATKNMAAKRVLNKCFLCNHDFHKISMCPKFINMEPSKRFGVIKDRKMCFSCFSPNHSSVECPSNFRCRTCGTAAHHTMLHPSSGKSNGPSSQHEKSNNRGSASKPVVSGVTRAARDLPVVSLSSQNLAVPCQTVLLGTAVVQIQNQSGGWIQARCVIDPGSQISAVSESLAQVLGLPRQKSTLQVSGIGSAGVVKSRGLVSCTVLPHKKISSLSPVDPLSVQVIVLPTIASDLPSKLPVSVLHKFSHLQLADLCYQDKLMSTKIDMLLGAEYYTSILVSTLPIVQGVPAAIPSRFGWLLMGRVEGDSSEEGVANCASLFISAAEDPVASQLRCFWELEELREQQPSMDPDEMACEKHFVETHTRDSSGRYIVRLPFRGGVAPLLESNRTIAWKRLQNLNAKLSKNSEMKTLYRENLNSYLQVGHMAVAKSKSPYLLVHHGVYKESSSTPLRVVFDPNIAVVEGASLSKALMVGPKLQAEIGDILIQFRLNAVALLCDIKAMYRGIWLAEEDCKFQHILWYDEDDNIVEYELKTVTFGLPPSPFLAQRVIKQLGWDEGSAYPEAARVLDSNVYVDDIVTGSQCVESAMLLRAELTALLGRGGFVLRKWASSHPEVLQDVAEEHCEKPHRMGSDESIKVLGLQWCPKMDSFYYSISATTEHSITKRRVLSVIASIYDVNGFLSPVTVWLKIFMQQIWLHKDVSWDTVLPSSLQRKWNTFIAEVPLLEKIRIPRYVLADGVRSVDLVGFSDGSSLAYSAVVYLRVTDLNGVVELHLLRAKTKVAPLKTITINKMELCGAVLLARTVKSLSFLQSKLKIGNIYLFSDSTTVLAWLVTPPHSLKTFVANRVVKIIELTRGASWRHVLSAENSADPASRGVFPSQFVAENRLWFKGPEFLVSEVGMWPHSGPVVGKPLPEIRTTEVLLAESKETPYFMRVMERYSSLTKVQTVIGWTNRFVFNARNLEARRQGQLSIPELKQALLVCVRGYQAFHFHEDISAVRNEKLCSARLRTLSPFMDSEGILRVGGRLANSVLPYSAKHPILVPKCHMAKLLVWHYHRISLHGGPKLVQSLLQQRFWIVGGRNLIRQQLSKCVVCIRNKPQFSQPYMADLPISRFAQGRPFINVGVDYAGAFAVKTGTRRNSPMEKCYFALFVCMSTKCVHLELVSSLSTPAFLAALDRFVGRRGLPSNMWSDNGTTFKGANAHLQGVYQFLQKSNKIIEEHLRKQEIKWCFIPPSAPNFGGLWEAGVKSAKHHLKRVLNGQIFNFEELSTLLVQIEAILNSRPLCALSSNPNDGVDYLTPGHFLIGSPLIARPEHDVSEENVGRLTRWKRISHASQCFWKRWSSDYLNTLMQRTNRGSKTVENLKCGDVVLVASEVLPSQKWPLGRVTEILPGGDGVVRVVKVKTASGEILRPTCKLVILPSGD